MCDTMKIVCEDEKFHSESKKKAIFSCFIFDMVNSNVVLIILNLEFEMDPHIPG